MPIEAPVDIVAIDVMKRIHSQLAPLDIEPSTVGIAKPIGETNLQFRGRDDIIVRGCVHDRFTGDPEAMMIRIADDTRLEGIAKQK